MKIVLKIELKIEMTSDSSMKLPKVAQRFIKYVQIHTTSDESSRETPSTPYQFDLAKLLVEELNGMGVEAGVDENCIVLARIPSNLSPKERENIPSIAFIAHLDTSPSEPGNNVKPVVTKYTGGDLSIRPLASYNADSPNFRFNLKDNPQLEQFIGDYIITSDGSTLLGADDKAGIAEIMQAVEEIMISQSKEEVKHGDIVIVFTPDEEIGKGTENIDLKKIKADFAYTIDGGGIGELEIECFNAANGKAKFTGFNVHPGYAYNKMNNSIRALRAFLELFPDDEAPETTRDRQGYYHIHEVIGKVNFCECSFILRDFDSEKLEQKIKRIGDGLDEIKKKYPKIKCKLIIERPYKNMRMILENTPEVIDFARRAIEKEGIKVVEKPIRGGTDGASLTFKGLPTPNIFSGGYNFHSKSEWIPVSSMVKAVKVIKNIISLVKNSKKQG